MFPLGFPQDYRSKHVHSKIHSSCHAIAGSFSEPWTSSSSKPMVSRSVSARSTTQPTRKTGAGAIAGGVVGALLLFVIFVGLLVVCIRRKGPASHSKQGHGDTNSSTNDLVSTPAPLDTEAGESNPKAGTSYTSFPGTNNLILFPCSK